jgi:hypothetical protein
MNFAFEYGIKRNFRYFFPNSLNVLICFLIFFHIVKVSTKAGFSPKNKLKKIYYVIIFLQDEVRETRNSNEDKPNLQNKLQQEIFQTPQIGLDMQSDMLCQRGVRREDDGSKEVRRHLRKKGHFQQAQTFTYGLTGGIRDTHSTAHLPHHPAVHAPQSRVVSPHVRSDDCAAGEGLGAGEREKVADNVTQVKAEDYTG